MELLKISSNGNGRRICFLGEGNFSFCRLLCQNEDVEPKNILATCYEPEPISDTAKDNIDELKAKGVQIKLNFDATKMDAYDIGRFDLVIFMFPHIGGKMKIDKNRELLKKFGLSVSKVLNEKGQVLVTLCDGQGGTSFDIHPRIESDSWQILKMMSYGKLALVQAETFQLHKFPGYNSYGYRSLDKPFHNENGTIHVFKSFPSIFEASNESIKMLESPQYVNDISFWYDEKDFKLDIFKETVTKISEKSVIDTQLIDEYFCSKRQRTSMTFRLTYVNLNHIINPEDVMILHYKIGQVLSEKLNIVIR